MGVERSVSHWSSNVSTNIPQKTQCATEPGQSADGADLSDVTPQTLSHNNRHGWRKNEAVDEHIHPNTLSVRAGRRLERHVIYLFSYYSLQSDRLPAISSTVAAEQALTGSWVRFLKKTGFRSNYLKTSSGFADVALASMSQFFLYCWPVLVFVLLCINPVYISVNCLLCLC